MTNFLFYGLVSEQSENKNKSLRMRGHYIHIKPIEIVKSEFQRYLIDDSEILSEQRFISKKFPSEIPIFFKVAVPSNIAYINVSCPKCSSKQYAPDNATGLSIKCSNCKTNIKLTEFDDKAFLEFKKDSFNKAEAHLKTKFSTMVDNYQMCV